MIEKLSLLPPDKLLPGIKNLHSYRGYYSDLAFEWSGEEMKVSEMVALCKSAMGQVMEGYKGGDFMMGASTPVWTSDYGINSGDRLMDILPDGTFVIEKESE
jgi:hypothetical protein